MKIKMFDMKNLLNGINGRVITAEKKICEHEVKAALLENKLPWSFACSCVAHHSE